MNSQIKELEKARDVLYSSVKEYSDRVDDLKYEGEFNYACINNFAAQEAKGEFLLLLNNDVEFINKDFIKIVIQRLLSS